MIHITYSGWIAIFCLAQLAQLGLFGYYLRKLSKAKDVKVDDILAPLAPLLNQMKTDLIKDAQARNAILIRLYSKEPPLEENQAQQAKI